jgi:hypothetical protein
MALFDSMKNKISAAGQTTVRKAMDITEVTKLQSTISATQDQIRELYTKLGSEVYEAYCAQPLPDMEERIREIAQLHQKVEQCKSRIYAIQAVRVCPQCGSKAEKTAAFCSTCGFKFAEEKVEEAAPAFCSACGAAVVGDAVFCTNCGNKLNKTDAQ